MDMAPEDERFKRVEPDDPHRCSGVAKGSGGQCIFEATKYPDGTFGKACALHGGAHYAKQAKKEAMRLYQVTKYRGKMDRMQEAGEGVYLDEELAVLRMTLETALERYSEVELITMSGQITSLVRDIRDTLVSNNKLKSQLGALMDRATIDRLCDAIVAIIAEVVEPSKMDSVCAKVAGAVANAVASRTGGES